jgi:hypothetical protein
MWPANKAIETAGITQSYNTYEKGSLVMLHLPFITINCMDQANTMAKRNNKKKVLNSGNAVLRRIFLRHFFFRLII